MDHGSRTRLLIVAGMLVAVPLAACTPSAPPPSNASATNASAPATQSISVVERPQKIKDQMAQRGEQDSASPTIEFAEPKEGATIKGSTVSVKLTLSGDLKGYHPMKDPATGMGNHIHVILDNQPYEAYYNLDQAFELRNVAAGKHTLRVFASRPWHESYKNATAFKMVSFTVEGGGDASKPTTTGSGQVMADNKNATAAANKNATEAANKNAAPQREGKDMPQSVASDVDPAKPLLTYSRPKGEYKGDDANAIMIDFWLSNAKLTGDGGEYKVRYSVDGGDAKMLEKWEPIWLSGWTAGKHTIKLELVDKDGKPVANGDYNTTTRDITVTK
jgi:hypothetical protein